MITNTTQSDNPASGALKVSGGVGIAKNLNVGGTAQIDSTLTVKEQGTFKAKLIVEGETSLNNNKLSVGETVNVSVDTTINSSLTVKAKASVEGGLEVAQATKLKDTLTIDGNYKTTLGGELEVSGSSDLKSTLNVAGATTLQDSLVIADGKATTLGGDVTAKGNLNVASNIAAGGNIVVSGGSNTHNLTLGHNTDTTNRSAGSVLVYTNAGNEGFKLDETGKASIFNGLVINSTQETDAATKLIVGGEATIQGALRANSLILPTTTATEGHGNLVAKNITATNEIVTNKLVVNSNRVVVDNDKIALSAPQITLTITDEDKFAKVAGRFETTGYTKLNDVIINTGDMEGIKNLTATGTIKANKFNATSDLRKKTNIEDYTCEHSILDLPIKSFEYINDDTHSKYIGCLAQDLQKICPEIVDTDKDGFLSIQETKLVYLLLDEVKKLKEQLETLKGE